MSITSIVNDTVTSVSVVNALKPLPPTITNYSVGGLDDTALDPAGGQTVQINGTGFLAGATITFDGSAVAVVTYVNPNQLTFTSPAKSAGTYTIYVVNPDGGTAIYIPGIIYSVLPTWTTSAGTLGSYYETTSISNTVIATGDAPITYSLFSGSLPTGSTLYANGVITGTAPVDSSSTTYSFTIQATDAQLQDSTRSFSLTINVDAVTWVSPANATTYTSAVDSAIANVTLSATDAAGYAVSYSANALPTGLSLSGANITGTPTVIADSSTLLTATAATTNRTAVRTINWSITVANDPYFEYNTLLIPGASTTFVDDASTNNFAVTINGDTKPNNFNPYTPGYYSNYFDGTGDYLLTPSSSAVSLGTGDFTIEGWFYNTGGTNNGLFQIASTAGGFGGISGIALGVKSSKYSFYYNNGTAADSTGLTISSNAWNHFAVVRYNGVTKVYLNGVVDTGLGTSGSITDSTNYTGTYVTIGGIYSSPYVWQGNISNYRIVKGTAVYTTAFTPPTSPLTAISGTSLLTCQSNRFIDTSTTALAITVNGNTTVNSFQPFVPNSSYSTYGSGYFDGTGDYLNTPSSAALTASGDFTIETWIYITAGGTAGGFILTQGATTSGILLGMSSANILTFKLGSDSGGFTVTDSVALPLNTWIHVAGVRSGNTLTLYKNGVSVGTTGSVNNTAVSTVAVAGRYYTDYNGFYFNGYISDARLVVGTAVYTTTFTPPTSPLTAISGTSLLTLQNNQSVNNNVFLDNSTNNFFVTRNGNTTQGTFSPYGGNWSNYFDGTGDSLQAPSSASISGTGDFTAECWIYPTTIPGSYNVIGCSDTSGGLTMFGLNSNGTIFMGRSLIDVQATTSNSLSYNTWNHIAISRSSGTVRLFINGIQGYSGSITTNYNAGTVRLGTDGGGSSLPYTGYISNFRIITNSAIYTSNFTPSTTPLTPITNTSLLTCQSNRIVDTSINNFTITKAGDTSVQRFSPFNPSSLTPTSYSGYFDGSGDYLSIPTTSGSLNQTGDFTYEMWIYWKSMPTTGYQNIAGQGQAGQSSYGLLAANAASDTWSAPYVFKLNIANSGDVLNGNTALVAGQWYHLAHTRTSGVNRLFVNGVVQTNTYTDNTSRTFAGNPYLIGNNSNGYISNFRFIQGTSLYTTTFTPPTTPLTAVSGTQLLTLQSSTFIDNSTNNFTITAVGNSQPTQQNPFGFTSATTNGYTPSIIGGSGYFDGTGDTISVPFSSAISLGTSNFTMEAWCYPTTTTNGVDSIWGSAHYSIMLYHNGTSWTLEVGDGGGNYFTINGTAPIYAWNHMAVTRSGSTFNLWINGVSAGTGTTAGTMKTSGTLVIGGNGNGQNFTGYITDFRLVKGTALYTSSFVPPSAPLLAVQNTALLTNMTSAGIYDAAMMNNMETIGDAKLSTAVSKFGGSSMYFDGNDNLSIPLNTTLMNIGTGDFTIEGWVYHLDSGTYSGYYYGGTNGVVLRRTDANKLEISHDGVASIIVSTTSIPSNQWVFVTGTRSGSTVRIFINGTIAGTATYGTSIVGTSAGTVGSIVNIAGYYMNGYIDDLRITRGYARYTANFTAPTSAFQLF